ncbi:MAG: four helix bundle protein [Gemmatimonadales bacterium]
MKACERCHQLCVAVYRVTDSWPQAERFGLTSQVRRAAHSAAANIAEGCA